MQARGDNHAAGAAEDIDIINDIDKDKDKDIPLSETEKEADRLSDWWMRSRDKQHVQPTLGQPTPLHSSRSPSTSPPSVLKSAPLLASGANRRKVNNNVHWHFAALGSEGENKEVQGVQEEGRVGGQVGLVCGLVEVGRGVTAARARCHTRLATTNLSTIAKQTPALSSPRTADPTGRGVWCF
jgi:hypothetical protein